SPQDFLHAIRVLYTCFILPPGHRNLIHLFPFKIDLSPGLTGKKIPGLSDTQGFIMLSHIMIFTVIIHVFFYYFLVFLKLSDHQTLHYSFMIFYWDLNLNFKILYFL